MTAISLLIVQTLTAVTAALVLLPFTPAMERPAIKVNIKLFNEIIMLTHYGKTSRYFSKSSRAIFDDT